MSRRRRETPTEFVRDMFLGIVVVVILAAIITTIVAYL